MQKVYKTSGLMFKMFFKFTQQGQFTGEKDLYCELCTTSTHHNKHHLLLVMLDFHLVDLQNTIFSNVGTSRLVPIANTFKLHTVYMYCMISLLFPICVLNTICI